MIIGLFVHTTCPSSEVFRCLPRRKEIFDGMLGTNLICSSRGTIAVLHRCAGIFGGHYCALSGWGGSGEGCGGYPAFAQASNLNSKPSVRSTDKNINIGRDTLDVVKAILQKAIFLCSWWLWC
ncbi:hypothetical protein EDB19DRAFT_1792795 [Suillus lakei]|nr:hypothetical protein EDB19DRAFT_1792795 [Suillus lakei]